MPQPKEGRRKSHLTMGQKKAGGSKKNGPDVFPCGIQEKKIKRKRPARTSLPFPMAQSRENVFLINANLVFASSNQNHLPGPHYHFLWPNLPEMCFRLRQTLNLHPPNRIICPGLITISYGPISPKTCF